VIHGSDVFVNNSSILMSCRMSDLIISNNAFIDEVGLKHLAPLGKSDHSVLCVKCCLQCNYRPVYNKLNYNKGVPMIFGAMWNVHRNRIIIKTHELIPTPINVLKCSIHRKLRQPLSEQIRNLVKEKTKACKKYITTKSIYSLDKFKQIISKVHDVTRARLILE